MADQLRYDVVNEQYMPNVMRLVEEGVQFENCYTASPLCVPARGAFFTGCYPNNNGSLINPWSKVDATYGDVKSGIDNLYTLMENDWTSIHSGKQHLYTEGGKLEARENSPTSFCSTQESYNLLLKEKGIKKPGGAKFRTLVPEMQAGWATRAKNYSTPATGCFEGGYENFFDGYFTERALDALKNRDRTRPLLLNLMYLAPHPPFDIPEPWYSRFDRVDMPKNVGVWYDGQSPLQLYNLTGMVGSRYSRQEWSESWRVYLGLVSLLDDCIGKILDALKEEGIYDESLILFTSDHGEMLGSHRLFQKMCMYEESVRVPLVFKLPASMGRKGEKISSCVSLIDVFPTLCELLALRPRHDVDGESLLPQIMGKKQKTDREAVYIQYDGNGARSNFQRCIVKDGYKLIVDLFKDETFLELYRLESDPEETENLIFDSHYDDLALELLGLLSAHMIATGDAQTVGTVTPSDVRQRP